MSKKGKAAGARVTVVGASGRMGQRLLRLLPADARLSLHSVLERGESLTRLEVPAGVVKTDVPKEALEGTQVVIDFSAPAAVRHLAPECAAVGVAYLVASTGLSDKDEAALQAAQQRVPVLQAANLSLGVNVLLELVEVAARQLGFDVEISEVHHRLKKDAPSGTALALARAVERGRGPERPMREVRGRQGIGEARQDNELGLASLRGGDVAGEHTVYFFGESERLELTHRATSPDIFARGALDAAAWLVGKPAGRYAMSDVLAGR